MYLGNRDIINIVDALARDKGIQKEHLIVGIESAIEEIGKTKYGTAHPIKARFNRKTGEINLYRVLSVVDEVASPADQISLQEAQNQDPELKIGDEFYDLLPPMDLGRHEAMIARTAIVNAVRKAEKEKEYENFIHRIGDIITGPVKRVEYGHLIVDLGKSEAILKRDQLIPTDRFMVGDLVKAYIAEVRREDFGSQIFLSRTSNKMLVKLFEMQVPEIRDGLVQIRAIARDPGSKAKVAVSAVDYGTDPIACCVGIQGSRIKAITEVLNGEKIDVVAWSDNILKYVTNALSVSQVKKVQLSNTSNKIEVVVPVDVSRSAVGRGGQNVRLASKLVGYNIEILTEDQESERRLTEFHTVSKELCSALDLEEVLSQFLVAKGFLSVKQIANTQVATFLNIEGFDEELATALIERAQSYLEQTQKEVVKNIAELGVEDSLISFLDFLDLQDILELAKQGIKSLEDLVLLEPEDLKAILPNNLIIRADAEKLIQDAKSLEA